MSRPTDDILIAMMSVPEVCPCSSDRTIEFWLGRLKSWGKADIKYKDADGRTNKLTLDGLKNLMTREEYGMGELWDIKKKSMTSLVMTRKFNGRPERVDLKIKLHPDIKKQISWF